MHKYLLILLFLSLSSYAIDFQSKSINSDKSSFETVGDNYLLDQNRYIFNLGYDISSNTKKENDDSISISGLSEIDFSLIAGVSSWLEIGIYAPYRQFYSLGNSEYKTEADFYNVYLENKIKLNDNLSIVPTLIFQSKESVYSSSNGYGLKILGSIFDSKKNYLNYSLGYYNYDDSNVLNDISQRERIQASVGYIKNINSEIQWGLELFQDVNINRNISEVLSHITLKQNLYSIRSGIGSGFNQRNENELRLFINLLFDINNKKKDQLKYLINSYEKKDKKKGRFLASSSIKGGNSFEKIKSDIANSSLINEENLEDYTVIPFYSVKDLKEKKEVKEEIKKEEVITLKKEDLEYIKVKFNRLKDAYDTIDYNIRRLDHNRVNYSKVKQELQWGLKVVQKRKDTMNRLKNKHNKVKNNYFLTHFEKRSLEQKAKNKIKEINSKIVKLREEADIQEKKNKFKEKERISNLKKEQQKAWEVSKTHTLQDLIKEGKVKSKLREITKKEIKIQEPVLAKQLLSKEPVSVMKKPIVESKFELPSIQIKDNLEINNNKINENKLLEVINYKLKVNMDSHSNKEEFYERIRKKLGLLDKKEHDKEDIDNVNPKEIKDNRKNDHLATELIIKKSNSNSEKIDTVEFKMITKEEKDIDEEFDSEDGIIAEDYMEEANGPSY